MAGSAARRQPPRSSCSRALASAGLASPAASAHALLRRSDRPPVPRSAPPPTSSLTFSEPPDPRLSSIKVVDQSGTDHVAGPVVASPPATISASRSTTSATACTPSPGGPSPRSTATSRPDRSCSASARRRRRGARRRPVRRPARVGHRRRSQLAGSCTWGSSRSFGAAWVALAVVRTPPRDLLAMAAAGWALTFIGTRRRGRRPVGRDRRADRHHHGRQSASRRCSAIALVLVGGAVGARGPAGVRRDARLGRPSALTAAIALPVDVGTGHAASGSDWILQFPRSRAHGLARPPGSAG